MKILSMPSVKSNKYLTKGNTAYYPITGDATVTYGSDYIRYVRDSSHYNMIFNDVDLTDVSYLQVKIKGTAASDWILEKINATTVHSNKTMSGSEQIITFDVSAYSGVSSLTFIGNTYNNYDIYEIEMM